MSCRLPKQPLEWIDRDQTLEFSVEGSRYQGLAGDSITSALMANGVKHLGRSFKYHRLRGALSLANHDVNAMYQSPDSTHIRGDVTPVESGMDLNATNTIGGLAKDKGRFVESISRLLPVGFYYKAFYKPKFMFKFWENIIRHMAGLGVVDLNWSMKRLPKRYGFCDVLVIGAGPSGMAAALAASKEGKKVMLVDENPHIGGSLDFQLVNDAAAAEVRDRLKSEVTAAENIELHVNAVASGYYGDHWVPVTTPNGIIKVRAKTVIAASGLFEQPAVFHNNDVPGVMLASGAQRAVARFAVKPCEQAVLLVANEEGYRAALDMLAAGIEVAAIADLGNHADRALAADVIGKGVKVYDGHAIYEVIKQNHSVAGVKLCPVGADGQCDTSQQTEVKCDGVLMSVGWAPASNLLYQAGGKMTYDDSVHQFVPKTLPNGVFAAGRVNGVFDLSDRIADGEGAAKQAVAYLNEEDISAIQRPARSQEAHSHAYPIFLHPKKKNFVDIDEDVQLDDLINAASEGFDNIELMKRFTTIGMGPSQGKHANMNGIRVLSRCTGLSIDDTGSTTSRPFFHPVPVKHLAGRRFRAERFTPMHSFHEKNKAVFMEAGPWLRPEYYDTGVERIQAIRDEVVNVRNNLGLIDVSTLGKIEVFGPDAPELMDRLYTMRMSNMKVGMTRYALMVDEAGVVIDDGVAARYSDEHFYFTTTTSTSDSAYRLIQRYIIEWGLDVQVVNRTGQLAAMNLAGPVSRKMLQQYTDIDLSEESFPYLGYRSGKVMGKPAILLRVGFVGELGYEIHVRASDAAELWNDLMEAGKSFGIKPFGVEAQRLLRLEKAHIIVGQDTDGLTNPYEANMSWAAHLKKDFFLGKRSLEILKPRQSKSLHGFMLPNGYKGGTPKECHLLIKDGEINGRVTSVSYSPTFDRIIGLAFVDDIEAKVGDAIEIRVDNGDLVKAELVAVPFYDPEGKRQTVDVEEQKEVA